MQLGVVRAEHVDLGVGVILREIQRIGVVVDRRRIISSGEIIEQILIGSVNGVPLAAGSLHVGHLRGGKAGGRCLVPVLAVIL